MTPEMMIDRIDAEAERCRKNEAEYTRTGRNSLADIAHTRAMTLEYMADDLRLEMAREQLQAAEAEFAAVCAS